MLCVFGQRAVGVADERRKVAVAGVEADGFQQFFHHGVQAAGFGAEQLLRHWFQAFMQTACSPPPEVQEVKVLLQVWEQVDAWARAWVEIRVVKAASAATHKRIDFMSRPPLRGRTPAEQQAALLQISQS